MKIDEKAATEIPQAKTVMIFGTILVIEFIEDIFSAEFLIWMSVGGNRISSNSRFRYGIGEIYSA